MQMFDSETKRETYVSCLNQLLLGYIFTVAPGY